MASLWTKIWQWTFVLLVALCAVWTAVTPLGMLWFANVLLVMVMIALTRGNLEKMLGWYIVALASIHFVKRLLYMFGPVPLDLYHQVQVVPVVVMLVMLAVAVGRLSHMPMVAADIVVGLYFLLGAGITIGRAMTSGDIMSGLIAVTQNSAGVLCYYVGRALSGDAWKSSRRLVVGVFAITFVLGLIQFVSGPTPIDVEWAMSTGDTSLQAGKVLDFIMGNGEFRPYATFSDHFAWGLFTVFVWAVIEGTRANSNESSLTRIARRVFFFACLTMTLTRSSLLAGAGMLFFHWLLKRRVVGHPVAFVTGYALGFVGIVLLVQYLLQNVMRAYWMPQWSSAFLQRMFAVGTLSPRSYALEEFSQAIREYGVMGLGWLGEAKLTSGVGVMGNEFQSHNAVISLMIVTGVPGVLLGAAVFVSWLRRVARAIRRGMGKEGAMLHWAAAMILGYMATASFAAHQFMDEVFWLMVGWTTSMALAAERPSLEDSAESNAPTKSSP